MNDEIDRLKRDMVCIIYNNNEPSKNRKQFKQRIMGLFYNVDSYVSNEYYKLSPSKYEIKYGDEGPTMCWYDAAKIAHAKIMTRYCTENKHKK